MTCGGRCEARRLANAFAEKAPLRARARQPRRRLENRAGCLGEVTTVHCVSDRRSATVAHQEQRVTNISSAVDPPFTLFER